MALGTNGAFGESAGWRERLARSSAGIRADLSFAVIDLVLISFAYITASAIRMMDPSVTRADQYWVSLIRLLPLIAVVHIVANFLVGGYGHVWEFASIGEAKLVIVANSIAAATIVGFALAWDLTHTQQNPIPLSVLIVGATFSIISMGAVRFRSRLFSFNRMRASGSMPRVIVVGTQASAARFARDAMTSNAADIVGFVTLDIAGTNSKQIAGRSVLGDVGDLRSLVDQHDVEQIVLSVNDDSVVRRVVDLSLDNRVRLSLLPSVEGALADGVGIRDPRDLEVVDMLPRPQVDTHVDHVRDSIEGRRVLITGAGGSIGSEILRQVKEFNPSLVIALDHDETHLHDATMWMRNAPNIETVLCDIREERSVDGIFDRWRPDVVFHAAAHKHVPILQNHPDEAIKTNVIGTKNVIDACHRYGASRFVLISTDKAVAPANVMGATKRMAEILVQAADVRESDCVFTAVRFGNVLGSRGSVVPTFVEQIKSGGPVTITDPDMTRFFMTIAEAVQLVLQAGAIARGGEIHVLDMGQPVRIIDLAHRMIRLAGLVPGVDIEIEIVGRRPGEKITEELALEPLEPSSHPRITIARPALPGGPATVHDALIDLREAADAYDVHRMMEVMTSMLGSDPGEVVDLTEPARLTEWS